MLTLYGVYRSRASRPLWVLLECQVPFAHVPVTQAYRLADPLAADAPLNTASPGFLAINPSGQVPALRDGALVLTESLAICLHIARKHGGAFGPQSDDETALMENWALFAATAIEPPALDILYTLRDKPEGSDAILAAACDRLKGPLARIEAHLTGRDWLFDRFTVADIVLAECVRYATGHAPALADFPQTRRWLAAAQARPAFQTMWAARLAEPD
ncbi:MAG: glutathione S-transferase family protein [Rhodobacteraceae bacterium]|nr:glutathione S-transferase family protein [Paracoccaceae bacterium]